MSYRVRRMLTEPSEHAQFSAVQPGQPLEAVSPRAVLGLRSP